MIILKVYKLIDARSRRLSKAAALSALIVSCFVLFASTGSAQADNPLPPPVEVFDVQQGKVVHTLPLSNKLKKLIINALNHSPSPYKGVTMNPTSGIIVHVRFAQPVKLRPKLYPEPVNETYLFLDQQQSLSPLALLFFSKGHPPRVYTLQAESDDLLHAVQPK